MPTVPTLTLLLALQAGAASPEDPRRAPTLEARVGPVELPLPPKAALFLLDELDLTAWYLNKRGLLPYTAERAGPRRFRASDAAGTRGFIELVESGPDRRVWLGEGTHRSRRPLIPELQASAAIVLTLAPSAKEGCPPRSAAEVAVALRLKNPILAKLAWLVEGYVREALARRFARATAAARKLAALWAEDPRGIEAELAAYPRLTPAKRRELSRLARELAPLREACR